MSELTASPIHALAPELRNGTLSPVELLWEALRRIDELDPRLHAFITVTRDEATRAAAVAEAELRAGQCRGPLHGIPVAIKDNIAMAGYPTTCGSKLLAGAVTDYDATVVAKLRQAGAVIVGKTNLHEWAMGATCYGGPWGTIRNPWDENRMPGGSSGGSAVAVSVSMAWAAVGTDGRGSIRNPAAYCGLVGLKPTQGLVSRFGQLPPTSTDQDHLGPIARDVTDCALMLNALAGHDGLDPTSIAGEPRDYTHGLADGLKGLRVGVPRSYFFELATAEVGQLVQSAIQTLAGLGAEIRELDLPWLALMRFRDAIVHESRDQFLPYLRLGPSAFSDETVWERMALAQLLRAVDSTKAARVVNVLREHMQRTLQEVDLLALPTVPCPPLETGQPDAFPAPDGRTTITTVSLTAPFNVTGNPAISIPCGFTGDGLPTGLMLAGRHWQDDVVLRAAYAFEQASGLANLVPLAAREVSAAASG